MTITKVQIQKDFSLNSTSSCVFHHCQWESCETNEHASLNYTIYRFLFMLILVSSITFSTLCQSHLFPIFLTNWSFTLQTLYGILFFANIVWRKHDFLLRAIRQRFGQNSEEESIAKNYELKETTSYDNNTTDIIVHEDMSTASGVVSNEEQRLQHNSTSTTIMTTDSTKKIPDTSVTVNNNNIIKYEEPPTALEKLIWILMNMAHVLPHLVSFGYWVFVYKYDPHQLPCEKFRSHFIVHAGTSVLALIDSLVVAVPARITHSVFPTFVLAGYSLFSYFYEIAGGPYREGKEYIYSILNWRYKASRTAYFVMAGTLLSPLVHTITCWGVHHIRLKLVEYSKRFRK